MSTIHVFVESEPHNQNLGGEILNRPAPGRGAFLIDQRIPREIWEVMKKRGATYYSADDLEDLDMFDAVPGWRYSVDAVAVLLQHGYVLKIRDQTVQTVEQLQAMFTEEEKAAYRARVQAEREAAEQAEREQQAAAAQAQAALGAGYRAWKDKHLTGLTYTSVGPPGETERYEGWEPLATFDKSVPGTWYTTGDQWSHRVVSGQTVLRCHYGNATIYYAPQAMVDAWYEAQHEHDCSPEGWSKGDIVAVARSIVRAHDRGCLGDDKAKRLVELHGLDHYLQIARSEEWLLLARHNPDDQEVAQRHGIPYVVGEPIELDYQAQVKLTQEIDPQQRSTYQFYSLPDGRIMVRAGLFDLRVLPPEQAALVKATIACS